MALREIDDKEGQDRKDLLQDRRRYRGLVRDLREEIQTVYQRAVGVHTLTMRLLPEQGDLAGEIEWTLESTRGLVSTMLLEVAKAHKDGKV